MQTIIKEIMAEAFRDTTPVDTLIVDVRTSDKQSFFLVNTCNQIVDCQLKVSGDNGVTWQDVGSAVNVAASTGIDWIINSDAYTSMKIEATPQSSPASGTMTITSNLRQP